MRDQTDFPTPPFTTWDKLIVIMTHCYKKI
jgi:hypothetical protein